MVVVGDKREQVEAALAGTGAVVAVQEPQLGTAHAALQAKDSLAGFDGIVLVCFGDCPMLTAATVLRLCGALDEGAAVAVLGFRPTDAAAYGRIIADADGNQLKPQPDKHKWTPGTMHIHDLNATILHQLGIDHRRLTYRYQGRDFRLTDVHGHVVNDLLA